MRFSDILASRYATKRFTGDPLPAGTAEELLSYVRLAPSSFGLQPFTVVVVTDAALKERLRAASYDQPQITECSHLLVFCARSDVLVRIDAYQGLMRAKNVPAATIAFVGDMMRGSTQGKSAKELLSWAQKQCYIALGNAVNGAKELGYDSCPMEGFDPEEYAKILELPEHLVPTVLVAVGVAADEPRPKIRFDDLFDRR